MTADRRARILALTNWYPPHHYGGYEISSYDVLTRLEQRGHAVAVLCSDHRKPGAERPPSPEHEANVDRSLRLYFADGEPTSPPWRERLAIERHNQRALAAAVERFRPDVLAVWHMGALSLGLVTAAAERGLPIVHAICDDWLIYGPDLDRWAQLFTSSAPRHLLGRVLRPVLRVPTSLPDLGASGAVLAISEQTMWAARTVSPWSFPVATVVGSGIDRTRFPTPAAAPEPKPWGWRLVFAGRFDERKGADTLIRALPLLPAEATAILDGRGGDAERARLAAMAEELGVTDRVAFHESAREELGALYSSADCVVFPSVWPEPFGLVPIEAMSCGTPVAATGVGGSGEFLADGVNCVLFPPGDAEGLAAAVRRLADDPALRQRLVAAGYETAELYDVEHLTDTFEQWYVAAADRYAGGRPPDRDLPGSPPSPPPPPSGVWIDDAESLADRLEAGATSVVWARNRRDLARARERLRLWARSLRPAHLGIDRDELVAALPASLEPVREAAEGWEGGRKRDLATKLVQAGPLRRWARLIGVEVRKR